MDPSSDKAVRRRGGHVQTLGELLPGVLERVGPRGVWTEARLRKLWPRTVGADIAAHTRIRRLRGTTLEVDVDSETWATELRYLSVALCERLNDILGAGCVKEIIARRRPLRDGGA